MFAPMSSIAAFKYTVIFSCLCLAACAPSREFAHVPQEGANRAGIFPRFSDKPQAETAQFTRQETVALTQELDAGKQAAAQAAAVLPASRQDAASSREALKREVEETLKAIAEGDGS